MRGKIKKIVTNTQYHLLKSIKMYNIRTLLICMYMVNATCLKYIHTVDSKSLSTLKYFYKKARIGLILLHKVPIWI